MPDLRKHSMGQVRKYLSALRMGATLKAAAAAANVDVSAMRDRIERDPRFASAVQRARGSAQFVVENSLYTAATTCDRNGRYDTRAQELWLKNADPEWRRTDDSVVDTVDRDVRKRAQQLSGKERDELRASAHDEILTDRLVH